MSRNELQNRVTKLFAVTSPKVHVKSDMFEVSDNFIGLEHEIEGAAARDPGKAIIDWWHAHVDNSLRGGVEWVTRGPMMGAELFKAIEVFSDWAFKTKPEDSFRTSTHVHIDFSQERDTLFVIQDFLSGYYILEDAFFAFGNESRKFNGYCIPFSKAEMELVGVLNATDEYTFKDALSACNRYYGCNPASLAQHGTIEFRHLPLTFQKEKLIDWINIILRLKKFVLNNSSTETTVLDRIKQEGVSNFAEYVFGKYYDASKPEFDVGTMLKKLSFMEVAVTAKLMEKLDFSKNPLVGSLLKSKKEMAKGVLDAPQGQDMFVGEPVPEQRLGTDGGDTVEPDMAARRTIRWTGNMANEPLRVIRAQQDAFNRAIEATLTWPERTDVTEEQQRQQRAVEMLQRIVARTNR